MTTVEDVLSVAAGARTDAPPPGDDRYDAYCGAVADQLTRRWDEVMTANAADVAGAVARGLGGELVDRLTLTDRHLAALVDLAAQTRKALPGLLAAGPSHQADNGMVVRRVPKPLGVVLMIFEARPTVTVEGALLPVAVGNVAILRGGAEIAATNMALAAVLAEAAAAARLPAGMVQVVTDADRRLVRALLQRHDAVDVLVPRGSPSLIDYCLTRSAIPVIASGGGTNHLYVDRSADVELAAAIALDSKLGEPTACNTLELALAHAEVADGFVRALVRTGARLPEPWTLRLDPGLAARLADELRGTAVSVVELSPDDIGREFLDRSIGVRAVADAGGAIAHIRRHGSGHTEGVVATDRRVVERFLGAVDAAALVVNGSLRLHDGPTMALGPELSISTGRLHVRGPVNLSALLTHSWVIDGQGALRGMPARERR